MSTSLTLTRRFDYPAENVFDAFLNPELAGRFLFATETGEMVRAEIDPQVGGSFVFADRRPGQGIVEHHGTYLDIDRPSRLMFTFSVGSPEAEGSLVTIELSGKGAGACELTLSQELSPAWVSMKDKVREGWTAILAGLDRAVASAGGAEAGEALVVKDSNGAVLAEGDSVTTIKDLPVKGAGMTLKRGTMIKNIHLTDDAEAVECKVSGSTLVLKTCFLKKA